MPSQIKLPNPKETTITARIVKQKREEIAAKEEATKSLSEVEKIMKSLDIFINESMTRLIDDTSNAVKTKCQLFEFEDSSIIQKYMKVYEENKSDFNDFCKRMESKYGLKHAHVSFNSENHFKEDDMCKSGDGTWYYANFNFHALLDI